MVGIGRVWHELVFTNKYLNVSTCLVAKDAGVKLYKISFMQEVEMP